MVISRAQRRQERTKSFEEAFGKDQALLALDLLEVLEFGWHDCYGEVTPPPEVVDDILVCADGRLDSMIRAVRLSLSDWRDLRLWADDQRAKQN